MGCLFYADPTNTAKGYLGTPARYKTVTVKGQQVKLKWCATCQIWRPPRASHCGLCNNCYGEWKGYIHMDVHVCWVWRVQHVYCMYMYVLIAC